MERNLPSLKHLFATLIGGAVATLALLLTPSIAGAANFIVDTVGDSGDGSLREAITDSNASGEADVITITANGSISLRSALPAIVSEVEINGPGVEQLTVQRGVPDKFRIFTVAPTEIDAPVKLSGLTITGGEVDFQGGGGIRSSDASLTLERVLVGGNIVLPDGPFDARGGGRQRCGRQPHGDRKHHLQQPSARRNGPDQHP